MKEWKEVKLGKVITINPRESIAKGILARKIGMDNLDPFKRRPIGFSFEKYNGGVKFRNKDTIMARITPCLENGKTGFISILEDDEVAYGSTEYIVFREKKELTDSYFIYYLVRSNIVRDVAIASMTGSSGRQRVQTDVVLDLDILLPPLPEQKAIAQVLSSLDDKIELLNEQNKTLEQLAETLFRQWFVEEAEEEMTIGDIVTIQNGYAFKSKDFKDVGISGVVKIKNINNNIVDINNTDFIDIEIADKTDKRFEINSGDVLIAMTGAEIGKLGVVGETKKKLYLNQRVGLLRDKILGGKYLAFLQLKSDIGQDYIDNTATGSAQPNISATGIENCPFPKISNELLIEYSIIINELFSKNKSNQSQIQTLTSLRDTLLPKLMSGEVRVDMN